MELTAQKKLENGELVIAEDAAAYLLPLSGSLWFPSGPEKQSMGTLFLWKKGKISRIMILKILSKQWIGGCLYANFKKRLEVV